MDIIFWLPVVAAQNAVALPVIVSAVVLLIFFIVGREVLNSVRVIMHIFMMWFAVGIIHVYCDLSLWLSFGVVALYHAVGLGSALWVWKNIVTARLHEFIKIKNHFLLESKLPSDYFETGDGSDHQFRRTFSSFLDDLRGQDLIDYKEYDGLKPKGPYRWQDVLRVVSTKMNKEQVAGAIELIIWWPGVIPYEAVRATRPGNWLKLPFVIVANKIFK